MPFSVNAANGCQWWTQRFRTLQDGCNRSV